MNWLQIALQYLRTIEWFIWELPRTVKPITFALSNQKKKKHWYAIKMVNAYFFINLDGFVDFIWFADGQFGLIFCIAQDMPSYYPKAFYRNRNGLCDFGNVNTMQSLDGIYSAASKIISMLSSNELATQK